MSETPYDFDFFLWKLPSLGKVEERRQSLDTGRTGLWGWYLWRWRRRWEWRLGCTFDRRFRNRRRGVDRGCWDCSRLLQLGDFILISFFQLIDIFQSLPTIGILLAKVRIKMGTANGSLLSRFAGKLLLVLLQYPVRLGAGYQKPNVVDLRPSPLRSAQIRRCSANGMPQRLKTKSSHIDVHWIHWIHKTIL